MVRTRLGLTFNLAFTERSRNGGVKSPAVTQIQHGPASEGDMGTTAMGSFKEYSLAHLTLLFRPITHTQYDWLSKRTTEASCHLFRPIENGRDTYITRGLICEFFIVR